MNDTPGIAGLVNIGNTVDTTTHVRQMLQEMKTEVFHVIESYSDPPVGMGRVHLGVDNPDQQPIFSKDHTKCIVMVGKIHSYRALPHDRSIEESATNEPSAILSLYSKYGLKFVNFLNGSFLLAVWDSTTKRLIIVNDRYGLLPLYYASLNGLFLFSTEAKSILRLRSFPRVLDERSVADFFSFGYILGDRTLLKDVKLLPRACFCTVDARQGDITMMRYWDPIFMENPRIRLETVAQTLDLLIKSSIRRQVPREKPFGLTLSGGIDSRIILAEISPSDLPQIYAFTVGMKEEGSDQRVAKMLCDTLQIQHHRHNLKAPDLADFARKAVSLTDGMWMFQLSYGSYPTYHELKKRFDTVFVGTAGELFHGGNNMQGTDVMKATNEDELSEILFRKINSIIPYREQGRFFTPAYRQLTKYSLHDLKEEVPESETMSMIGKTDYFFLKRAIRTTSYSVFHMRNFFECREPFYDYDLMDFVQFVSRGLRGRALKQVFSTSYRPKLANIPYARFLGVHNTPMARHLIPGRLEARVASYLSGGWTKFTQILQSTTSARFQSINRHPMADINYWFRTELRDFIERILFDPETLARPYFNQGYIYELVKAHMLGKKNVGHTLGALVTFELWQRMFFDE